MRWMTVGTLIFGLTTTLNAADPPLVEKYLHSGDLANGEQESGVTIHKIEEGMDTGPILHQGAFPLTPFDTYRSLSARPQCNG